MENLSLTVECATDDVAKQQQEKKCSVNVEKWKTKVPSAFEIQFVLIFSCCEIIKLELFSCSLSHFSLLIYAQMVNLKFSELRYAAEILSSLY